MVVLPAQQLTFLLVPEFLNQFLRSAFWEVSGRQASDVAWSNADVAEQTQTDEQEGE